MVKSYHHFTDFTEQANWMLSQISFQSNAELRHLEVFIRWADVVVLVYSITDKASFNLVLQLMEQVKQSVVLFLIKRFYVLDC